MTIGVNELLFFAQEAAGGISSIQNVKDICNVQVFASVIYSVFPALKHYCPLSCFSSLSPTSSQLQIELEEEEEEEEEEEKKWEAVQTLLTQILGIPSNCLNVELLRKQQQVKEEDEEELFRILTVLFFFNAVAKNHAFQEEFAITLSPAACEFLQSESCVSVLLRGGAVPAVSPVMLSSSEMQKEENHVVSSSASATAASFSSSSSSPLSFVPRQQTNRQLDLGDTDPRRRNQEKEQQEVEEDEERQVVNREVCDSCSSLKSILTSYADMVDAALGSPELSASSKHRAALQVGLQHLEKIEKEHHHHHHHQSKQKQKEPKSVLGLVDFNQQKTPAAAKSAEKPPPQQQEQQQDNSNNAAFFHILHHQRVSEEMQEKIIKLIKERDRAVSELQELKIIRHSSSPSVSL